MKVVAVCGSPRKGGNTEKALIFLLDQLKEKGVETQLILTAGKQMGGCLACQKCKKKQDGRCYGRDDDVNPMIEECLAADAILLGSPVYFGSATAEIKCLIDRLGYSSRASGSTLKRKIGGAVVVARRAGQNFTFAQIAYFFSIMGMVQVGSSYWNILFGKEKGDALNDQEGMETLQQYAENLYWALTSLKP
jgi:multimeric flavodoxin WrbA